MFRQQSHQLWRPFAFVLALVLATCAFAAERPPIQVWFGPHPIGSPNGLDTHFIELCRTATKTLDGGSVLPNFRLPVARLFETLPAA